MNSAKLTANPVARSLACVRRQFVAISGTAAALLLSGCGLIFGGVHVETVSSAASPPSNVAVYLTATDSKKQALRLQEEHFQLFEDGKPLDPAQVQLRILPRDTAAEYEVLLLVDLSGPIDDRGARRLLASQLVPFVERLRTQQRVRVYGFDGAPELIALGTFPALAPGQSSEKDSASALFHLSELKQRDPSSNLNGALLASFRELTEQQSKSRKPVRLGSVVVVARGPDLAGRAKENAVFDALRHTTHRLYAVTIGEDKDLPERIGPSGHARANRFENIETALAEVAAQLENDFNRYYLLSYCSPARSGKRELMIRVERTNSEGELETAKAFTEFRADGFRSGCDSSVPPRFVANATGTSDSSAAPEGDTPAKSTAPAEPELEAAPPPEGGNYAL